MNLSRLPFSKTVMLLLLLLCPLLRAQNWQQNDLIFNPSGIPSPSFSQPRFADLDADGDFDLILGNLADRPMYFENVGSATQPAFQEDEALFQSVRSIDAEMGVCHDLDNDGDLDLISGGYTGLHLYENTGDSQNPQFSAGDSLFAELITGPSPVPTLADIDADGDLDLLVGFSESGLLKLYRNTGTADSAVFSEANSSTIDDIGLYAYPYFCDLDMDSDVDILAGRDGHGFRFYRNTGDSLNPAWQLNSTLFSGLGDASYWNSPCLVDLSGDGKIDLIYGTAAGPLQYYKNSGSNAAPVWTQNQSLFGGVLDVGGASSPDFIDFDHDGDLDMLSGSNLGSIKYFRNTGSAAIPAWQEASSRFSGIKHSIYAAVTAGDVDGDSLIDVIAGDLSGALFFHRNTGSGFQQDASVFSSIDLGDFSAPKLVDMDADADLDLVVGNGAGQLFYFENSGTPDSASWTEIPAYFGDIDVGSNCVPALTDIDGDGDIDLLTGDISGELQFFRHTASGWAEDVSLFAGISGGQNCSPAFADLNGDGKPDLVLGNYGGTFSYFENQNATGIEIAENPGEAQQFSLEAVYPNPFNGEIVFRGRSAAGTILRLEIYDLRGHSVLVRQQPIAGTGEYRFLCRFPEHLASGTYIYHLKARTPQTQRVRQGKIMYLK